MCVIMVCDTSRPTEEMVEQAFDSNGHGSGIAWRERDEHGPYLRWYKGIDDVGIIQDLIKKAPMPFVAHFRIASVGAQIKALTHPFPVSEDVPLNLQGTTRGSLLFHNGTWHTWRSVMLDCALRGLWHIPAGAWSDSRAMAKMAHHLGAGYLDFFENERIIVFDPAESPNGDTDGINFLGSQKWVTINDVCCSNSFFSYRRTQGKDWREVKDASPSGQPAGESRFDAAVAKGKQSKLPIILGPSPLEDAAAAAEGRDRFDAMLAATSPRAGGASDNVVPFVRKGRRAGSPRKRNRKHKTMDMFRNAIWRKAKTISEANLWFAQKLLTKNQYKKALQMLCKKEQKTWEVERATAALLPPPTLH